MAAVLVACTALVLFGTGLSDEPVGARWFWSLLGLSLGLSLSAWLQ